MDTARVHAVIATTLGDADLAGLGPLTLRVGQRLLAEVLSIQAETGRTILSLAGRRIEAQVPTGGYGRVRSCAWWWRRWWRIG